MKDNEIHIYEQLLNNKELYLIKKIKENNSLEYMFLFDIIYNDIYRKNFSDKNLKDENYQLLDIMNSESLINEIKKRVYNYTIESNKEFCISNKYILSGYITYYLQKYNLFMATVILVFLLYYGDFYNDFLISQHCNFILSQKRLDGRVGYINPLLKLNNFNEEEFYNVNNLCYKIISKIFK